jgi:hypothetical protein
MSLSTFLKTRGRAGREPAPLGGLVAAHGAASQTLVMCVYLRANSLRVKMQGPAEYLNVSPDGKWEALIAWSPSDWNRFAGADQ